MTKFTRYDILKALEPDEVKSFMAQVTLAKVNSGRKLMILSTPTKRRGNTEERNIVTYSAPKFKRYLTAKLDNSRNDKKLIFKHLQQLLEITSVS